MQDPAGGAGDLLERQRECAVLEDVLGRAIGGSGGLVFLEGNAGLGKSRLARWSVDRATDRGMTSFAARSDQPEREFAFGVVLQLFGPWMARASKEDRREVLSGAAQLATPLFDVRSWHDSRPPGEEQGLFHGLHWVVANIAERQPVHICVDDGHWADGPSLRFLRYLAQRIDELPLSLLVTSRPVSYADSPDVLAELSAHALARRLELSPLSRTAVDELVRKEVADADEVFSQTLWQVTGGNPLFVNELIHAIHDGDVGPHAAELGRLAQLGPRSVSHYVLARIARLGEDARALAAAVAVLGDGAPMHRAAALAELDDETAARAADELIYEEIFTAGEGGELGFAHPLTRAAVYGDLPTAQRGQAHLRAARALVAEAAEPENIATQLLAAPPAREPWAAEVLARSAERARSRGAPEHAIRYLRRALDEPLKAAERAQTLIALAQAEVMVGEPQAAGHLDEAITLLEDEGARAQALAALGRAHEVQGRHREAADAFERALTEVPDPDKPLAREISAAYAGAASVAADPKAFERIQRIVERPAGGETTGELSILAALAVQQVMVGAPRGDVLRLVRRAWADGRLLVEEGWGGQSWSLLTGALYWVDEFDLEEEIASAALDAARASGSVMASATASYCLVWPAYGRGQIAKGLAYAEQAFDARRYGWETFLLATVWGASNLHMDRGDIGAAEELVGILDEPRRSHADQDGVQVAYVLEARGRLRLLQDRPTEALEDYLRAGLIMVNVTNNPAVLPWQCGAALAAHRIGDVQQARELTSSALEIARPTEVPRAIARPLRAAGLIEGGDSGLRMLHEAVDVLDEIDAPLERASSLLALGSALRRSGERLQAQRHLHSALDLAHRSGALLIATRAQQELRSTGARPRRIALSGVDSLTPGELRVAEMASKGMTNREIAQALFVTVHAVDKHLRGTYQKLNISSRRGLSALLGGGE